LYIIFLPQKGDFGVAIGQEPVIIHLFFDAAQQEFSFFLPFQKN
jgi:hypothetical protein